MSDAVFIIDGGTTRTRLWAVVGDEVVVREAADVGARDTAREGSNDKLRTAVFSLLARAAETCRAAQHSPRLALAAGMITSPQGLAEVPHVAAPADAAALAQSARAFGEGPVPLWLIPGVRSGAVALPSWDAGALAAADVMRGEETLALGLARRGGVLLSVGSHWKAIAVDGAGAITGSVSTLSGELLAAVAANTILASALPQTWPARFDGDALRAGARAASAGGLPRALYLVRLLEQRAPRAPEERLAFAVGAAIAADREILVGRADDVVIAGGGAVATAWAELLTDDGRAARVLGAEETEAGFRRGALAVARAGGLL